MDTTSSPLIDIEHRFVELWGNMSSLWGVNPAMARVHGLLFITGEKLSADDIVRRLKISRGAASMSLAKLVDWGLVERAHQLGERRDYFLSVTDVWEMFTRIAAQRKRREIDPVLSGLQKCRDELAPHATDRNAAGRLHRVQDLLAFLTLMDHLAQQFFGSHKDLRAAVELLSKKQDGFVRQS